MDIRNPQTARFLGLALCCISLTALTGCKTPTHAQAKIQAEQRWSQVRGKVKLQLARQQFERGHFEDTIKTLHEATALDPTSVDSYALLAKANLELGKLSTAEQVIESATKLGLASAELHYSQGVIQEQRNELGAALAQYEKAHALDASRVSYLLARIETLAALDRLSEALALADANANQFDDDASVALLGARIAALMGDVGGALTRFQNPAIQSAGSRVATEELASFLANQGHCSEAIRLLEPLVHATDAPELALAARHTLAECYLKGNEAKQAVRVLLSQTTTNPPGDRASQLLLAKAALAAGEHMTALQALEAASQSPPHSSQVDLLLAATHWKRGDLVSSEAVLDRVLSANPNDVDAWCLLGEVLLESGRNEAAKSAFERALDIDPECQWAGIQLSRPEGHFSRQNQAEKKFPQRS